MYEREYARRQAQRVKFEKATEEIGRDLPAKYQKREARKRRLEYVRRAMVAPGEIEDEVVMEIKICFEHDEWPNGFWRWMVVWVKSRWAVQQ